MHASIGVMRALDRHIERVKESTFGEIGEMRNLAIQAALTLAGCSSSIGGATARNDFKGQPLSAVQVKLGNPDQQQTIAGQNVHTWFKGQSLMPCTVRVVMATAGDVVDSYETTGDPGICSPYDFRLDK
jgi:hypothetical protein